MKYFKLNKSFLLFFTVALFVGISSCKKVKEFAPLGDNGPKMIGFINGGPEGFSTSSLAFPPSLSNVSYEVRVLYTGAGVFDADVTLTIAKDAAALTAYNASVPAGGVVYTMAPNTIYSLPTDKVVIKKGNTMSEPFVINFKPDQFDLAISYMLPLSITAIAGAPGDVTKAPGTGTIYLHIIGNPLAGDYDVDGYFYHPASPRAFIRPDPAAGTSGFLTPVSDKALYSELGDLGTAGYYAIFTVPDPFATTIQNVTISVYPGSIDPVYQWNAGLPTTGVPTYTPAPAPWGKSALCNNTYNPATKTFYLRYGYLGGTGWRVTEEIIKKH